MANPFVHIELNTSDLPKARSFYGELLDWELKDVDMGPTGTYTTISVGDGTGGGMMKHPMEGAPSLWIPYILVTDVAAKRFFHSLNAFWILKYLNFVHENFYKKDDLYGQAERLLKELGINVPVGISSRRLLNHYRVLDEN
jgi:catechol 2,3-dioxygenase-like lactoylglutathione lyase family enzyme